MHRKKNRGIHANRIMMAWATDVPTMQRMITRWSRRYKRGWPQADVITVNLCATLTSEVLTDPIMLCHVAALLRANASESVLPPNEIV